MPEENRFEQMANYSDRELAELAGNGEPDAFVELSARYFSMIRAKAARFSNAMLETEDLCQEGLVGLLNAARTYNPAAGAGFKTYAGVCIGNRMIMACRKAASQKNLPLHNFVSLSDYDSETEMTDPSSNPETVLIDSENLESIRHHVEQSLTQLERKVFMLYVGGCTYNEISAKLGITSKAADNALQRVRLKLKNYFNIN